MTPAFANQDDWGYKGLHREFDEEIAPPICARAEELPGCGLPGPAIVSMQKGVVSRLAQQAAAPAVWRSRTHWEYDWRKACWMASRLTRIITIRCIPCSFKAREGHHLPRYLRDLAAGQFRLDARTPIMVAESARLLERTLEGWA